MTGRHSTTLLVAAGIAIATAGALADSIPINTAGTSLQVPVTSFKQLRLRSVVLQRYDFSCGSAALATLLTYHYRRPTSEEEVFEAMYAAGDQEKIRAVGFSLLDMKLYLDRVGLRSDGFELLLDDFVEVGVPAITLIEINGYKHFVVVRGIKNDRVLIADPARGTIAVPRADFENSWNGVAFFVRDQASVGRSSFNDANEWGVHPRAPIGTALSDQALGSLTLHMFNRF